MARFDRTALFVTGSLLAWAADFLFLYVFIALACEKGFPQYIGWASIGSTAIVAAISGFLLHKGLAGQGFVAGLAAGTALLALIGIAFVALPALLLPRAC